MSSSSSGGASGAALATGAPSSAPSSATAGATAGVTAGAGEEDVGAAVEDAAEPFTTIRWPHALHFSL
jgi:hypothetical protein